MKDEFHWSKDLQIVLEDIAEILASSKDSELRRNVLRYMSRLHKPCPSPNCQHPAIEGAFICHGYEGEQRVIEVDGALSKVEDIKSNPLVTPPFCEVFCRLSRGKDVCKTCRREEFGYRAKLDGLYCHSCGFFVDYGRRRVGYTKEWTTSMGNTPKFENSCSQCGRKDVSAKFGDYWFCNGDCLKKWYLSLTP